MVPPPPHRTVETNPDNVSDGNSEIGKDDFDTLPDGDEFHGALHFTRPSLTLAVVTGTASYSTSASSTTSKFPPKPAKTASNNSFPGAGFTSQSTQQPLGFTERPISAADVHVPVALDMSSCPGSPSHDHNGSSSDSDDDSDNTSDDDSDIGLDIGLDDNLDDDTKAKIAKVVAAVKAKAKAKKEKEKEKAKKGKKMVKKDTVSRSSITADHNPSGDNPPNHTVLINQPKPAGTRDIMCIDELSPVHEQAPNTRINNPKRKRENEEQNATPALPVSADPTSIGQPLPKRARMKLEVRMISLTTSTQTKLNFPLLRLMHQQPRVDSSFERTLIR